METYNSIEVTRQLVKDEQNQKQFELKAGHWYICHRAFCCRADHLTVKEGERFMCEKDGIVKGFVIKEPEKYFKEVCAPAPMEVEQNPADKDELFDHRYAQHLVESQRQKSMIQWKGDNLKEVIDFTGKDRNFDKWFKSFEEYEQYVQNHNGIFKLFNADGSHYEVPVGAWIVKTPDGCNVASKAIFKQNSAWSEDDEKMFEFCNLYYEHKVGDMPNKDVVENLDKFRDWLKSFEERYTWKPSDEQMKILQYLCETSSHPNEKVIPTLESLYNDLKKLKG